MQKVNIDQGGGGGGGGGFGTANTGVMKVNVFQMLQVDDVHKTRAVTAPPKTPSQLVASESSDPDSSFSVSKKREFEPSVRQQRQVQAPEEPIRQQRRQTQLSEKPTQQHQQQVQAPAPSPKGAERSETETSASGGYGTGSGGGTESGIGTGVGSGVGSGSGPGIGSGSGDGVGSGIGSGSGSGSGMMKVALSSLRYRKAVKPYYPEDSINWRETGTVSVRVLVGTDGRVMNTVIERSSGHRRLDHAAMTAAKRTSFYPYVHHGTAISVTAIIPYRFHLNN